MELIRLTESAYHLRGGSNAGLIVRDGRAVLVDTGLDKDTAKKLLQAIDGLGVRLVAVVVTHAHADHFGGAATVRARTSAPVLAPAVEAAVVTNPILEPLYLFSGALPPAELRHKFTLATACPVDRILALSPEESGWPPGKVGPPGTITLDGITLSLHAAPGHSPNQVMVAGGGVCFTADACLPPGIIQKHSIPFCVDIDQALASLAALAELEGTVAAFAPGHGPAVPAIAPWAEQNAARLREIRRSVHEALADHDEVGDILHAAAAHLGCSWPDPVSYWLSQTTILACLHSLQAAGLAAVLVRDNRLRWRPT